MAVEIRNLHSSGGEFIPPFSKGESLAGASGWGFELFFQEPALAVPKIFCGIKP